MSESHWAFIVCPRCEKSVVSEKGELCVDCEYIVEAHLLKMLREEF